MTFSAMGLACIGGEDTGWLRRAKGYADLLMLTAAHSEIVNRHTPRPREPVCAPHLENHLLCSIRGFAPTSPNGLSQTNKHLQQYPPRSAA